MLQTMLQSTASEPTPSSSNFASLLAALATPSQPSRAPGDRSTSREWKPEAAWNDDGLEDDVATFSYERALRTKVRYRSAPADESLTQTADPEPIHFDQSASATPAVSPAPAAHPAALPEPDADGRRITTAERNLKNASITIRMSKTECEQLHRRAAEAGLTVSAYLRSCTFEAESLRAMVKDTLAQMRSATTEAKPAAPGGSRFPKPSGRLRRLLFS
jgi:hypothetical protein